MTDATEQGGFAAPESSVDAASNAIAALLKNTPNPGNDEDESPAPAQTKQEAPAAQPEAKAAEAEQEDTTEPPEQRDAVERKEAPKTAKTQPETAETNPQDTLLTQLNGLIPQLQAVIAGEFRDVQTFEDLQRIAQEDPARYNRFVIHQAQLQNAQAKQKELQGDYHRRWYATEAEKLSKALPEIADPVKGPALRNEMRAFALKQGYSEQQIAMASSGDVLMLHKAMQFENWQKAQKAEAAKIASETAKAKEKAANAPPVQKPGTLRDDSRADKANEDFRRLQKSGRVDDAAKLFQHILG